MQTELSKLEECQKIEPFFTKSRPCIKQTVISSEVIYPKLIKKMEDLTDLLENRVNQNKISNDLAWMLLEKNLKIAVDITNEQDQLLALEKLNSFMESLN